MLTIRGLSFNVIASNTRHYEGAFATEVIQSINKTGLFHVTCGHQSNAIYKENEIDEEDLTANKKNIANKVITVTKDDVSTGTLDKLIAHQKGILHRAFSIFIFRKQNDQIETLLQQRAADKYHCANLWSNTCCSHPKPGENTLKSAETRLREEMGINLKLHEIGSFYYRAVLSNGLIEHEVDHVFVGIYSDTIIKPDAYEVQNYCWMTLENLRNEIKTNPKKYTPWLSEALELATNKTTLDQLLS